MNFGKDLRIVYGDLKFVLAGSRLKVGRVAGNEIQIDDPMVSSSHLIIHNGKLVDKKSTNGTWINGVQVKRDKKVLLRAGDIIAVGHKRNRLFVAQEEPPPEDPPQEEASRGAEEASPAPVDLSSNQLQVSTQPADTPVVTPGATPDATPLKSVNENHVRWSQEVESKESTEPQQKQPEADEGDLGLPTLSGVSFDLGDEDDLASQIGLLVPDSPLTVNTNDEEEEFNVNILGGDSDLFAPEMDSETSSPVKQPGTLTSIRESPEPVAAVPSTESDAAQPDFIVQQPVPEPVPEPVQQPQPAPVKHTPGQGILYERTYTGKKKRTFRGNAIDWKAKYHAAFEKIQDLNFIIFYGYTEDARLAAQLATSEAEAAAQQAANEAVARKNQTEGEASAEAVEAISKVKAETAAALIKLEAATEKLEASEHAATDAKAETAQALERLAGLKAELATQNSTIGKRDITIEALESLLQSRTNELDALREEVKMLRETQQQVPRSPRKGTKTNLARTLPPRVSTPRGSGSTSSRLSERKRSPIKSPSHGRRASMGRVTPKAASPRTSYSSRPSSRPDGGPRSWTKGRSTIARVDTGLKKRSPKAEKPRSTF